MKIHRYWEVLEDGATGPDGKRYLLRAWGGSDLDRADAVAAAGARLAQMQMNLAARGLAHAESYEYGTGVVREEVLAVIAGSDSAPDAVLTRNRYGSAVLNARYLFMADIDLPEAPKTLKFWAKPADPAVAALERVRAWAADRTGVALRAYRTPAGLRLLRLDRAVDAESTDADADLKSLDSDPLYRALCRRQGCFRARLGPKPWRVDLLNPPGSFPRDAEAAGKFADWLAEYEQATRTHAACRFVESIGATAVAADLEALVRLHDEQSGALSDRPLA